MKSAVPGTEIPGHKVMSCVVCGQGNGVYFSQGRKRLLSLVGEYFYMVTLWGPTKN